MIARFALASLFALSLSAPVYAQSVEHADDGVAMDLSAENWATTKSAHVTLNAEAAISAAQAGDMRADMARAVNDVARADWRMTSLTRAPDQTGLDRWSARFEARVPENDLGNLADAAKKAGKAGLQITVADIDFTPTLAEIEAARSGLRLNLYKQAEVELAALNAALPGNAYRIGQISFSNAPRAYFAPAARNAMMMTAVASAPAAASEQSEKIVETAHIVFEKPAGTKTTPAN